LNPTHKIYIMYTYRHIVHILYYTRIELEIVCTIQKQTNFEFKFIIFFFCISTNNNPADNIIMKMLPFKFLK